MNIICMNHISQTTIENTFSPMTKVNFDDIAVDVCFLDSDLQ